ncbi:MAG: family 31 glucosidase, partial [Anaerolineales bacterium]
MVFRQEKNRLIWEHSQERIQIEPWGKDALRVRGMVNRQAKAETLSALLPPEPCPVVIAITPEQASIRNGMIRAEICPQGTVRFLHNETQQELVAEVW